MKKLFVLIFCCLLSSVTAQKKSHILELEPVVLEEITQFTINKVIDKRLIKSNVGFAQKGLTNRRVPALLPDSFETYIKSILNKMIPTCTNCDSLVAIFHEFNVSEHTKAMSELGTFRMQVEFARSQPDGLYSVGYVETQIEGKGLDVTKKHAERALEGIKYCLLEFNKSEWQKKKGEKIDTITQFKFDFTKIPKAGLYSSFSKMNKEEPFKTEGYEISHTKGKYPKYFIKGNDGKRITNRVMGFSDGESVYLNASRYSYQSHFVKCKEMGKYMYFEDRFADPMAGVMFGLLGSALSNSAKPILLDTTTGLIIKLDDIGIRKFLEKYPNIKKEYYSSKRQIKDKAAAIKKINMLYQ